eukprot:scaffold72427_cov37-Prasinocladus_malaysianus.AAC.1
MARSEKGLTQTLLSDGSITPGQPGGRGTGHAACSLEYLAIIAECQIPNTEYRTVGRGPTNFRSSTRIRTSSP